MKSSRSSGNADTSRSRGSKSKEEQEKGSARSAQPSGRSEGLPKIKDALLEEKKADSYDDDIINTPVMFGDPFGNRGDYSKGIFYGGRQRFLYSQRGVNSLEPPPDFMTMRQKRNKSQMSKTQVQLLSKRLDFKRKDDNELEAAILARAEAKKNLQQSKRKVLVIKHQPTSKYDWILQKQAGCTFWVHKPTGTITSERPYTVDEDDEDNNESENSREYTSPTKYQNDSEFFDEDFRKSSEHAARSSPEELPATGSLVYDSSEFKNFLNILDSMQEEDVAKQSKNST